MPSIENTNINNIIKFENNQAEEYARIAKDSLDTFLNDKDITIEAAKKWACSNEIVEYDSNNTPLYSAKKYAESIGNIAEGFITILEELEEINGENNEQ